MHNSPQLAPTLFDTLRVHPYIAAMPRRALLVLFASLYLLCCGCESAPRIRQDPALGPVRIRIHPTFTQVKDWTGDGKPDGIEVVVELLDDLDDPVRASGTLTFELSKYMRGEPNSAGVRLVNPWIAPLVTRDAQLAHWSPALRAYTFQLAYRQINPSDYYVLSVRFESAGGATAAGGGRLFNQIVLSPLHEVAGKHRRVRPAVGEEVSGSRG